MKSIFATALIALATGSGAQTTPTVDVKDAWVRATVAQQKSTGAFMQLTAKTDTQLVEARSAAAGVVEVHEMAMDNNVMKMRKVAGLPLPAGQTVTLKPGGYHVMLMDLKGQVKEGDLVPVTLVFAGKDGTRSTQELKVPARAMNANAAPAAAPAHKH
jgi:hypothetical protein